MKSNLNKIQNLTSSVVNLACWDAGINSALDDFYERLKAQDTDSEKESVEQSNFDTLISNRIHTLIWAHRMRKLLWEGEPQFNDQNTARYNLVLEFEDDIQEVFDQQYEYLKNYAESLKNKDVSRKCLKKLEVIKSLYK